MSTSKSRATAYKNAAEAAAVGILADAGHLIAVSATLTTNGDGFLIADVDDPTILWDAEGTPWQSRVYCLSSPTPDGFPGKFRLELEVAGGE